MSSELDALRAEVDRLRADAGPKGDWVCDTCNFFLHTRVIDVANGRIGVPRVQQIPDCPNDGEPMRPSVRETDPHSARSADRRQDFLRDQPWEASTTVWMPPRT